MECLDANVVQDLMSGALDAAVRTAVLGHLDTCDECRMLLSVTARVEIDRPVDTRPYPQIARKPVDVALLETQASGTDLQLGLAMTTTPSAELAHGGTLPPSPVIVPPRRAQTAPGHAFGRYQLLDRLGAGAMGVVWRAEDPTLGRKIALKLLKRHDDSLTERLVREAQAMAQVNHPNVVAVYEVAIADGATYIAMELVQGQSLRSWQTAKRHTVPDLVKAYVAAGRGLAAAHAAGIIHRDFKADNVLVGDDGRVRVTDFGLAAAKPPEGDAGASAISDVSLTAAGSVLGTPAYMAPEQFSGGNVDSRTDQFNFCASLYEALYGQRAFDGRTFAQLGDSVCEGKVRPAPPGTNVSRGLRAILLRGLSVKPGDRYPTMDHLLAELGRDRARPWRRTAIAAAAIAAALGLGLVADWSVRTRVEGQIRQSFAATGHQLDRAIRLQDKRFQAASSLVFLLNSVTEVTSNRDSDDFGLGAPDGENHGTQDLHDKLVAQDWSLVRGLDGASDTDADARAHPNELAIVDYKARLLYTSASPDDWGGALSPVPAIGRALATLKGQFMAIVRYDDPGLRAAKVFGTAARRGLAMMFTRNLQQGAGGAFVQFVDGADVLAEIRIDDTALSLVGPDGTAIGDVAAPLVAAAPANGAIAEATAHGTTYQVQARPIADSSGQVIGRIVMARANDGVLSLFTGARTVFALAALVMLGLAVGTTLRARQITGARI